MTNTHTYALTRMKRARTHTKNLQISLGFPQKWNSYSTEAFLKQTRPRQSNENTALEADKSDLHSFIKSHGIKNRTQALLPFPLIIESQLARRYTEPGQCLSLQKSKTSRKSGVERLWALLVDLFHAGVWDGTIDILMRTKLHASKETHARINTRKKRKFCASLRAAVSDGTPGIADFRAF